MARSTSMGFFVNVARFFFLVNYVCVARFFYLVDYTRMTRSAF
jgi:hypothetical protein